MVGDTICDMEFGRNSGIKSIGVLSGVGVQDDLKGNAHKVIPSVGHLEEVL